METELVVLLKLLLPRRAVCCFQGSGDGSSPGFLVVEGELGRNHLGQSCQTRVGGRGPLVSTLDVSRIRRDNEDYYGNNHMSPPFGRN